MTWRNRNLFKNKAVPVQKFNMGGSVRGVEALKNVAPTLSTFDYDNAVNMMGGGMVDMPVPQMQMGGSPQIEMFESGDSAINEALNSQAAVDTMNQSLMTGGGDAVPQSMMAATPMAEETPMMNEGPRTSNGGAEEFTAQALEEAKQSSQDTIAVAMSEIEKEIDSMEEVSVDEMKSLAELIARQQQRLDDATVQLTKTMGLEEQPDITLFDNEFENEIEKKYPLVAAALAKTLPNIMDTDKLVATAMPSGDTPVATMQEGGDPADATGKTDEQIKIEALEKARQLGREIEAHKQEATRLRGLPTPQEEKAKLEDDAAAKKQKLLDILDQQIAGGIVVQREKEVKPPQTGKEYVEQDIAGRVMGNQRTFEDVAKQPAVQQIFSDLDDMAKKMGFGNIKDTKVTGSGAMTQAIRQKLKGESAGDAIKLQAKTKLLGDIEGDPFNTKSGALTTAKLDQLLEGDLTSDAAFKNANTAIYDWLASGQQMPPRLRDRIGVATSFDKKVISGTSMNFMDLFDMAIADPQVSTFINKQGTNDKKAVKRKILDTLVDAWNSGQFNIRQLYLALGIAKKTDE
jgi:hypothetical protein